MGTRAFMMDLPVVSRDFGGCIVGYELVVVVLRLGLGSLARDFGGYFVLVGENCI